jgi:hypothetical protein
MDKADPRAKLEPFQSSVGSTRLRRLLSPIFGSPSLCGAAGTEGCHDGCLRARGSILAGTWDVPAALAPAMGRRVYGEI